VTSTVDGGTDTVFVVDLRDGESPLPHASGGALVIDRAALLVAHADTYESLIRARRVTGLVCLVVGEDAAAGPAAVLSVPAVLQYKNATILWVGDVRGVRWTPAFDRVVPVAEEEPETLQQLIDVLLVPEVFDRVRAVGGEVKGPVASPGIVVVPGGVDPVSLAGARAAAVEQLTDVTGPRTPGDDALTVALRAGGADGVAPAPIDGRSPLGVAAARAQDGLKIVESRARVLGTARALIGRDRPTEQLGTDVMLAGRAAENYRLGLVTLLDRMDGHLLVQDPPPEKIIELGLQPPADARPSETAAGLHEFVRARLGAGHPLPAMAAELRHAATLAVPQGCTGVLERMRSIPPLGLAMPVFRRFPLSLWTLVPAFLTCAVVGYAYGPGWPGRAVALVWALAWVGAGWLLLARRPGPEAEMGLRTAAPVALPVYGVPALLGGGGGLLAALLVPIRLVPDALQPSSLTVLVLVALSVLLVFVLPPLCWWTAVRSWRRRLELEELTASVAALSADADGVIKREWQLVERRRTVAMALEVTAAGLDEAAGGLRSEGDRLFVPQRHRQPEGAVSSRGAGHAVLPELLDVVKGDLSAIALESLDEAWVAIESRRRAAAGVHLQSLDRLLAEYAAQVRDQGLMTPRAGFEDGPGRGPKPIGVVARDQLGRRLWTETPAAQRVLSGTASGTMTQLCDDDQLSFLSTSSPPASLRFAPQQVRRVLELEATHPALLADSGIVWSKGRELIGALRLMPVRLDAVRMVHRGGEV
jgi:hypothetical protein